MTGRRLTHHQLNVNRLVAQEFGVSTRDWVRMRRSAPEQPSWKHLMQELAAHDIWVGADQLRRWYGRSL